MKHLTNELTVLIESYINHIKKIIQQGTTDKYEILIKLFREHYLPTNIFNDKKYVNHFFPDSSYNYKHYVEKYLLPKLEKGELPNDFGSNANLTEAIKPKNHSDDELRYFNLIFNDPNLENIDCSEEQLLIDLKIFEMSFPSKKIFNEQIGFIAVWIAYFTFFPNMLDPLTTRISGLQKSEDDDSRHESLLKHCWIMANLYEKEKVQRWQNVFLTRTTKIIEELILAFTESGFNDKYYYILKSILKSKGVPEQLDGIVVDKLIINLQNCDGDKKVETIECLGCLTNLTGNLLEKVINNLLDCLDTESWYVDTCIIKTLRHFDYPVEDLNKKVIQKLLDYNRILIEFNTDIHSEDDYYNYNELRYNLGHTLGYFIGLDNNLAIDLMTYAKEKFVDNTDYSLPELTMIKYLTNSRLPENLQEEIITALIAYSDESITNDPHMNDDVTGIVKNNAIKYMSGIANFTVGSIKKIKERLLSCITSNDEDMYYKTSALYSLGFFNKVSDSFLDNAVNVLLDFFMEKEKPFDRDLLIHVLYGLTSSSSFFQSKVIEHLIQCSDEIVDGVLKNLCNNFYVVDEGCDEDENEDEYDGVLGGGYKYIENLANFTKISNCLLDKVITRFCIIVRENADKDNYKNAYSFTSQIIIKFLSYFPHMNRGLLEKLLNNALTIFESFEKQIYVTLNDLSKLKIKNHLLLLKIIKFFEYSADEPIAISAISNFASIKNLSLDQKMLLKAQLYEEKYVPIIMALNDHITMYRLLDNKLPHEISCLILEEAEKEHQTKPSLIP